MSIDVNWMAVVAATVVSMVVGSVWYHPKVMGAKWQKLAKISDKQMKEMGWSAMVWAPVRSFLTAYVLFHIIVLANTFYANDFLVDALKTGLFVFVGFVGPLIYMHNGFEGKPNALSCIVISQEFVTVMAMALTIGLIGL